MGTIARATSTAGSPLPIEWGVAARALEGQAESGDRHVVKSFSNGVLLAAVDGLGHGNEAAVAAKVAVATLERHAHEPVIPLFRRCHEALTKTRGVVMTLASFDSQQGTLTWLGVGNVEGALLREKAEKPGRGEEAAPEHESVLLRAGVVGYQLPPLRASVVPIMPGDTLIFATDGIKGGFAEGLVVDGSPQRIAERILAQHAKATDDALVLVARYVQHAP